MFLLGIATSLHHFSPSEKISWLRPCIMVFQFVWCNWLSTSIGNGRHVHSWILFWHEIDFLQVYWKFLLFM